LKMPAFEWVHVQLHQQKGMISLSPPTICNSAFVQSMPRASKQQARYAVGRCLMLWSSNDVTQQGSRPKTKLAI
ncbi:hypothetical protein, partial [Klebsiella pneumoniae]|uniref:hypothetical protein n=1 Tax=Klebsiella pneumoniae TaxID=573 RepID=UPI001C6FD720